MPSKNYSIHYFRESFKYFVVYYRFTTYTMRIAAVYMNIKCRLTNVTVPFKYVYVGVGILKINNCFNYFSFEEKLCWEKPVASNRGETTD